MDITLNGCKHPLEKNTTLDLLVEGLDLQGKRIAIEVNQHIIPRSSHPDYILQPGDRVEIVHAIGGG